MWYVTYNAIYSLSILDQLWGHPHHDRPVCRPSPPPVICWDGSQSCCKGVSGEPGQLRLGSLNRCALRLSLLSSVREATLLSQVAMAVRHRATDSQTADAPRQGLGHGNPVPECYLWMNRCHAHEVHTLRLKCLWVCPKFGHVVSHTRVWSVTPHTLSIAARMSWV